MESICINVGGRYVMVLAVGPDGRAMYHDDAKEVPS